jgi:hypothetical protein
VADTFSFTSKDWKVEKSDLWFYAGGGVYRLQQDSLVYIPLHNPEKNKISHKNTHYQVNVCKAKIGEVSYQSEYTSNE